MDYKDVAKRAIKTFFQVFITTLVVTDNPFSKAAVFSAATAAVTVVWNTVLVPAYSWFKSTM
jgi:hypothetical protein